MRIREQKDPSLSSKRICFLLIPSSVETAFYFWGSDGCGEEDGWEIEQRVVVGCRFQSNL